MLDEVGRTLITIGLALAGLGVLVLVVGHVPWLGRLPGDISIERGPVHVYVPLATGLLLSLLLTLALNLLSWRH